MTTEKLTSSQRIRAVFMGVAGLGDEATEFAQRCAETVRFESMAVSAMVLSFLARQRGYSLSPQQVNFFQQTKPYYREHLEYMERLQHEGLTVENQPVFPDVDPSDEFIFASKLVAIELHAGARALWKRTGHSLRFAMIMFTAAIQGELDESRAIQDLRD